MEVLNAAAGNTSMQVECRPLRYYDNIVYRDIFTNIAIRYFLLAITITAIEILCAKGRGSSTKY